MINGYGPSEDAPAWQRNQFFEKMDEELEAADINGCGAIIEMDANAKVGPEIIPGDPNSRSQNGELLLGLVKRRGLAIVNALDI